VQDAGRPAPARCQRDVCPQGSVRRSRAPGTRSGSTLADGKTIDLEAPAQDLVDGRQMRLAARVSRAQAVSATPSSTIEIQPSAVSSRGIGDDVRLGCADFSLDEAILAGAKVRIPTVEGPVVMTVAPGSTSGKTLRLKGRRLHAQERRARRPAGDPARSTCPGRRRRSCRARLEGWRDSRDLRGKFAV